MYYIHRVRALAPRGTKTLGRQTRCTYHPVWESIAIVSLRTPRVVRGDANLHAILPVQGEDRRARLYSSLHFISDSP